MNKGVIYILTNPSFEAYVKIGYADDLDRRLRELNRSECVPFAFRVYATYEVNSRLSDVKIHSIIDKLNPNLRAIETFNGKKRVREFYAISAEDAYSILEAISEIHGCTDKLKKIAMNDEEREAEAIAEEIRAEGTGRRSPFRFSKCGIEIGAEIVSLENPAVKCIVVDDNHVEHNGNRYSLSSLAKEILGWNHLPSGPLHFTYNSEILDDIRRRAER